ncbi:hypothetical protein F8388_012554 [Cannabis sativa]|uniref:MLO-like protein n=1 Tax=Cannabis sativa TaxID=3483 RepID=A0A7J6DTF2_CANSA|nr:hypothetical protein F8388_012554 [Cannabis sativa]
MQIVLLVGTKLELIVMEMAEEIQDRTTIVRGAPIVEPSNKFFWFNRPHWILLLIHFTLFENAFQMAYFLWTWYEFGITSCFHENLTAILIRVCLGIALQFLCSYITFPLYSLITQCCKLYFNQFHYSPSNIFQLHEHVLLQMGSHMKKTIFEQQTANALTKWHKTAISARKKGERKGSMDMTSGTSSVGGFSVMMSSGENTPSQGSSPLHLLHTHNKQNYYYNNNNNSTTTTQTRDQVQSDVVLVNFPTLVAQIEGDQPCHHVIP